MDNRQRKMDLNDWLRDQQARALRFGPKADKPFDARRKLPPRAIGLTPILPDPKMHEYVQGFRPVFRRHPLCQDEEGQGGRRN